MFIYLSLMVNSSASTISIVLVCVCIYGRFDQNSESEITSNVTKVLKTLCFFIS